MWPQRHRHNPNMACWRQAVASRLGNSCDFNRWFDLICLNHLQNSHEKGHAWQTTVTQACPSGLFGYAMSPAAALKGKLKQCLVSILAHLPSLGYEFCVVEVTASAQSSPSSPDTLKNTGSLIWGIMLNKLMARKYTWAFSPERFILLRTGSPKFSERYLRKRKQDNKGYNLKFFCLKKPGGKANVVMPQGSDTAKLVPSARWARALLGKKPMHSSLVNIQLS